jgi:glycosyltransferase involved in cell wall biosynthesis
VIFSGFTKNVEKYYQASDVFTLPSLYDPFGLVGIEALAAGLPSAVSIQSGCSSLIEEGVNGSVINDPTSAAQIENSLEKIIRDAGTLQAMKSKARDSVSGCTWDKVWNAYDKIFRDAAGERR